MVPVHGHLDLRCFYGAPWLIAQDRAGPGEIPYHIVVSGSALLEDPSGGPPRHLTAGDIPLVPHGAAPTPHGGSGESPPPARGPATPNKTINANPANGERREMLCRRVVLTPPHG